MNAAHQTLIAATLAAGLALAAGCATNPVTGKADVVTMSAAQEVEIGRKMHPQILQQYGRYADEQLQAYVTDVGRRIGAATGRTSSTRSPSSTARK
jgi:predicted Zn-dependent protease